MKEILAVILLSFLSFFLGMFAAWLIEAIKELKKTRQRLKELQNDKN
jgi:hypothetical protein